VRRPSANAISRNCRAVSITRRAVIQCFPALYESTHYGRRFACRALTGPGGPPSGVEKMSPGGSNRVREMPMEMGECGAKPRRAVGTN